MWSRPDAESVCRGREVSEEECRIRKYYQDDVARASAAKARNGGSQLEARLSVTLYKYSEVYIFLKRLGESKGGLTQPL